MILIYFLLGAAVFAASVLLARWAARNDITLMWYHWLGVAVVALMTLFVVAWIGTSLGEGYPKAATVGGLIFGGVDLVLLIGLRLLISATTAPARRRSGVRA